MIAIKCKSGKIFSGLASIEYADAEWKLQTAYYKAQGCIIEEDNVNTFEKCGCEHCSEIEHNFQTLIEEIKNS